jgi:hydroxymethylpyrimidine/phosphomethylpyrimidine kinase
VTTPAQQRAEVLERLGRAVETLLSSVDARILPEHGAQIGYAITGARDTHDVAAITGGIMNTGNGIRAHGPCAFGVDETIARIILTAMKFDPVVRCAATIRFSKKMIPVFDDLFFDHRAFSRRAAPAGLSTMDWGVASCCRDGVPDVIYSLDSGTEEPFTGMFGADPIDVTNNIIMLSNRIIHIEL